MVGDEPLLGLGQHSALFLGTGDDHLEGDEQVVLIYRLAAHAYGPEGGLVDQVGQVCAHAAGSGLSDLVQVHILCQPDVPGVDLEGGQTAGQVGPVHDDAPVKPDGTEQCFVQHLRPVGGA